MELTVFSKRAILVSALERGRQPHFHVTTVQAIPAWRSQPKWVVSRTLKSVGPNATLVADDIQAVIHGLKTQLVGEIQVGGPDLARSLTDLGLRGRFASAASLFMVHSDTQLGVPTLQQPHRERRLETLRL